MRFNIFIVYFLSPSFGSFISVSATPEPNPVARQLLHLDDPNVNPVLPRQQVTSSIYSSVPNGSPTPMPSGITTTPALSPPPPGPSPSNSTNPASTSTSSSSPNSTERPHNHNVAVGLNGTTFTPGTLKNIPVGDTLTFYFYPTNYSIVQSSFDQPCQPLSSNGADAGTSQPLFSGWNPTSDAGIARSKFVVPVLRADAMWLYAVDGTALSSLSNNPPSVARSGTGTSAAKSVCQLGMAMVVNPIPKERAGGVTLGNYKKRAASISGNEIWRVPGLVAGGEVRGVSDREKGRWEGRHPVPVPGVAGSEDGDIDSEGPKNGTDDGVEGYVNWGAKGKDQNRWLGAVSVLAVGILGLWF